LLSVGYGRVEAIEQPRWVAHKMTLAGQRPRDFALMTERWLALQRVTLSPCNASASAPHEMAGKNHFPGKF
jgi:hypothetical protein